MCYSVESAWIQHFKVRCDSLLSSIAFNFNVCRYNLAAGQAFVPRDQLASLVVGAFRMRLSKALVVASRRWAQHVSGEEKDRLAPVVGSHVSCTGAHHVFHRKCSHRVLHLKYSLDIL